MKRKDVTKLLPVVLCVMAAGCMEDGEETGADVMNYYESAYTEQKADVPQMGGNKFETYRDNPFVSVADEPVSTFSVDADGASYGIVRRYINSGYNNINPSSVRIEEFLNYFTFNYASPSDDNHVAINAEVGDCPWNSDHKLVRLGIKGKELQAGEVPQANFVFLVDVSGSMSGADRLDLLKKGLKELLFQLNPDDRISLITYSGEVEKLLESTPVSQADKIRAAIDKLTAYGCTAGGEALKMAYEEALANYSPECNNRVIMGTDGDFNVGVTSTDALVEMVESYAGKGIYMTCLGFGMGNLNDAMMEKISNAGNGSYHYIDSEDEMMKVFVHERERFVSVANDAKCQVTFDKDYVSQYRLIGYENRTLSSEDFDNDRKDAGEIGAGQTVTALYEVVPAGNQKGTDASKAFLTFDFRYKKTLKQASILLNRQLTVDDMYNKAGRSDEFYFAAGVAAYGMLLRQSPYKGDASYDMVEQLVKKGLSFDPHGYRAELLTLVGRLSGER